VGTQYRCGSKLRRQAVSESTTINGIDFLEVDPTETVLSVHFLHTLPGEPTDPVPPSPAPALVADNVVIRGGARFVDPTVTGVSSAGDVLTVTVEAPGDFSVYTLRLRTSALIDDPPDGFDPQLSEVRFTFKVECPSDFDCPTEPSCLPEPSDDPDIDYQAKDYASFRQLMLDRIAAIMPGWQERNPADVEIALVELLAYVGDHLSYFQDAVATEAYLGTALHRVSMRRHARLLDYRIGDGANARAWVAFEVESGGGADGQLVPEGTPVLSRGSAGSIVDPVDVDAMVATEQPVVFQTTSDLVLRGAHNRIELYTWGDEDCCLPIGATRATLQNDPALALEPGDLLLFEEIRSPTTGAEADADPEHRQVVRLTSVRDTDRHGDPLVDPLDGTPIAEVAWDPADALRFPLCLSVLTADQTQALSGLSVARGNLVLADHGRTVSVFRNDAWTDQEPLVPDVVPQEGEYRPKLAQGPLTFACPIAPDAPASQLERIDPSTALPAVQLMGDGAVWSPQPDLLGSDRYAPEFVVETESDGTSFIRFGDDDHGRRPEALSDFVATYRVGNGSAGNVGADALARVALATSGITRVRNPLPAWGGTDPEPLEHIRLIAPQAFRTQERAVTEADYADVTERRPDVQEAAATIRWTGSWYTAFVTVDRPGGLAVDAPYREDVERYLDVYRMAGYDLGVDGPIPIPLDVSLDVCVKPGYLRSDVERSVLAALGTGRLADGTRAFFHPDNFTFGQPVYLSRLYGAVMAVPGVASVNATRFQRFGALPNDELQNGVLVPGRLEIARLDNDPNFQENGRLELEMTGGL
jgi:hypothetical protein